MKLRYKLHCVQETSYTGRDHFVYKTLRLDVCVHVTTYIVNIDKSQNYNQEYVNIVIAVASILLYL